MLFQYALLGFRILSLYSVDQILQHVQVAGLLSWTMRATITALQYMNYRKQRGNYYNYLKT